MKLTFLGASGIVTGSKYLLEFQNKKILVDCGLFQGLKELRLLNWDQPEFDPVSIDAVFLTHGHLDHIGYLPRLVKLGFKGKIFASDLTLRIAKINLKDSAKIQEEEAERANKEGYSKHDPALPLYDLKDVDQTIKFFVPIKEGEWFNFENLFHVLFQYNGHILGSTFIEIECNQKIFVFSGDVGRKNDLLLYPPKKPNKADILLIESTYGGKIHPSEEEMVQELEEIINKTIAKKGTIFISSFAVERTQLLMVILWRLLKNKRIPKVPFIMDSPMGSDILDLFLHSQGWHKLSSEECHQMCSYFHIVSHYNETMQIRRDEDPKIVIAGSGMLTGGRILSYLEEAAPNEKNTLLLAGYQAEGTRGRKLLEGEKELKIYGKMIPVRMQICMIDGLSSHADQNELIHWLDNLEYQPSKIFIIHGEKEQAESFQKKLKEIKNWDSEIPQLNETITI